jgi:hypothetical protein
MIDTLGIIAFSTMIGMVLFLLGLMLVGAYFEIAAEVAEARERAAKSKRTGTGGWL